MKFSKGQHENWQTPQANLKGRDFFRPGSLMRALEYEKPCVLLIDELDKVDDGVEAQAFKRAASYYGRRSLPNGSARNRLLRLSKRLIKILAKIRKLHTA
jgi:hypothetical protein